MSTQGRSCKVKTPVVGMVERQGKLIAKKTSDVLRSTVKEFIDSHTSETTTIIADEYRVYNRIAHRRVNHSAGQYVIDTSHTNTIEGFWSLLKRGIIGIYHYISRKHLQRYVDEFVFRYNDREANGFAKINKCMDQLTDTRLTYKRLVNG